MVICHNVRVDYNGFKNGSKPAQRPDWDAGIEFRVPFMPFRTENVIVPRDDPFPIQRKSE